MAARNRIAQQEGRRGRPHPGKRVAGTLAVGAGYGLAVSALIVITVERMFGTTDTGGRLAVLGMTVAVLVGATAAVHARKSGRRRRPGGGGSSTRPT
ncbi:MAG TPA: hypothetical protein VKD26_04740 [Streptosporangiaceae bacterium]|nr:hypothetical protein [Streptosporangiaceae bacterium]